MNIVKNNWQRWGFYSLILLVGFATYLATILLVTDAKPRITEDTKKADIVELFDSATNKETTFDGWVWVAKDGSGAIPESEFPIYTEADKRNAYPALLKVADRFYRVCETVTHTDRKWIVSYCTDRLDNPKGY
jgi:hypothetical protein